MSQLVDDVGLLNVQTFFSRVNPSMFSNVSMGVDGTYELTRYNYTSKRKVRLEYIHTHVYISSFKNSCPSS